MAVLEHLATAQDADELPALLPDILAFLRQCYVMLRARRVPLEELLVTQKISRELEGYRSPSPAARAAAQLQATGKTVRPGQSVRFVYMRGEPGVRAWDCPPPPGPESVDVDVYVRLFFARLLHRATAVGSRTSQAKHLAGGSGLPAAPAGMPGYERERSLPRTFTFSWQFTVNFSQSR